MPEWTITQAQRAGTSGWSFQDRIAIWNLNDGVRAAAVFDGHGERDDVVDHCFVRIKELLLEATVETAEERLAQAFATLGKESITKEGGTTCSAVLLFPNGFVSTAVIGDSPIVSYVCPDRVFVSKEHNVRSNKAEAAAAVARGGIVKDGRLYAPHSNGGTQVARAFGDGELSMVLSTEPDIESFTVDKGHFLYLATDGLIQLGTIWSEGQMGRTTQMIQEGVDPRTILNRSHAYWEGTDDMSLIVCVYA